ncbi:uncharacterized protein LOC130923208 [Corythoichthys intestinalis]|uniref:uncharacterized protein LOC130923208 n=1 Tax=Corythoichthys intestinalis TaxID=161448 RepID=UPI0025A4DC60|nr:uncharacterized protein LOC130923208 [Corythoichthys intestinalis]
MEPTERDHLPAPQPSSQNATEDHVRPQRERHLPRYLSDFMMNDEPQQPDEPLIDLVPPSPQRASESRTTSVRSKYTSRASSQSSGRSRHSSSRTASEVGPGSHRNSLRSVAGICLQNALSPVQEAILTENIQRLELEELQSQIKEENNADLECQRLNTQAREAQRLQQETQEAREAIAKRMDRQRRLKRKEKELQVAKIVTSLLQKPEKEGSSGDETSHKDCQSSPAAVNNLTEGGAGITSYHPAPLPQSSRLPHQAIMGPSLQLAYSEPPLAPQSTPLPSAQPAQHYPRAEPVINPRDMNTLQQVAHPAVTSTSVHPHPVTPAQAGLPIQSHQASAVPTGTYGPQQSSTGLKTGSHFTTSSTLPHQHMNSLVQPAVPVPSRGPAYSAPETLSNTLYGVPPPILPVFERDRESDFALLKMALDNLMGGSGHLTEQYTYQVLLSHLKLPSALHLAKAYMYDPQPYTTALHALQDKYGQPRQLVQSELGAILNSPAIKFGDAEAFDSFALSIQSLVGMLGTLEGPNGFELRCGSHVDRLLSKMPPSFRDSFIEYCLNRGVLRTGSDLTYTLPDLATWLQMKSQAKRLSSRAAALYQHETHKPVKKDRAPQYKEKTTTIFLNAREPPNRSPPAHSKAKFKSNPYCPYCDNKDHFLNNCENFKKLSTAEVAKWIRDGKRCFKCGRNHAAENCNLKRPCKLCKELHLTVLHEPSQQIQTSVNMVTTPTVRVYLDRPNRSQHVMLKVVKVILRNGDRALETHAVLDDGSERSIILPQAVQQLNLQGQPETLYLQTIQQHVEQLQGSTVSFDISPLCRPSQKFRIHHAFTAKGLNLAEHSYPVAALQQRYEHLRGLSLPPIDQVHPMLLIGSDMPHLLVPTKPVRAGPPGGPVGVCTQLGWSLQGPTTLVQPTSTVQCLHISAASPATELFKHVELLWQVDTLPYSNPRAATRSKQDQQAMVMLQTHTTRVDVDGVLRYATPLLRRANATPLRAPMEAVLPCLRSIERKLAKDPKRAEVYCKEIWKLEKAGYVAQVSPEEAEQTDESWYIPHLMVNHNGKDRIVFNCSFQHQGRSLNELLLPGPTLGPTLLGVLIRFRQHAVAVSGDVKGMFHQIRLLPTDKSVLRFIWRNMDREQVPQIYEWQVLPFGTTCSPCCAIYALQQLIQDSAEFEPGLAETIEGSFYVDNFLHSMSSSEEVKRLIDDLRQHLQTGGFEVRQWASNIPTVVEHLPPEARSESCELWLSKSSNDLQEPALGLRWNCLSDSLGYKPRPIATSVPTLRNLYRILACQYDPLGYIVPFTTTAKVLIQDLWKEEIGWDDPVRPQTLLDRWRTWEQELPHLIHLEFPRPYAPPHMDTSTVTRALHIFCDASERAYGAVAYMRTVNEQQQVHVSFVLARSRVSPRKQLSMPRLELSAALAGAQLLDVLQRELTVPIHQTVLWSDSTTVLHWIKSESCRYKVFVGTRVAEIQNLTDPISWRYVNSATNPADDITRGLTLRELMSPHRWHQGPDFLHQSEECWPTMPSAESGSNDIELKKSVRVGNMTILPGPPVPVIEDFSSWKDLLQATASSLHGAANSQAENQLCEATDYIAAEAALLIKAQLDSFPDEVKALKVNRPLPSDSHLCSLSPEYDEVTGLLRVGGRLRRAGHLEIDAIHPIVLDPHHPVTKLLIQDYDSTLLHPGPERVLAEMRRKFWILRGREAIRKHQHSCQECQRWRAKPDVPKMADLPSSRLRLYKPPFYSTGMDCFGPFHIKIGRRHEKRWGILYKCMTTRCIHLDLHESLDSEAFLMSLRRFISRRGTPFELLCDNGTNFVGGDRELQDAFTAMAPPLKEQLAKQRIIFRFNPPAAPHFVLIEVEGILNAKPLGYLSSDVADPDPITPNMLIMGRRDSSLPQAVYDSTNLLGTRRWKHSQLLADHFWSTFIRHYLPCLQERQKWRKDGKQLSAGQVVLIVDPQLPRSLWPVGKVTQTHPGVDDRIRTATVQVKDRQYLRPVSRLVQIPCLPDTQDTD